MGTASIDFSLKNFSNIEDLERNIGSRTGFILRMYKNRLEHVSRLWRSSHYREGWLNDKTRK